MADPILPGDKRPGPLDGVVVADFSRVLAGPYATMLLADLGATVIKVEAPVGDDTRRWTPPERDGISTYYMAVNRNKHAIVLDLKKDEDLETAYRIIDRADVFVENFKPGGLKKFGLDEESVKKRWPGVIHASITGFGTKGGAHLPGYDLLVQGASGFMHTTGSEDGPPQRAGVAIFDIVTGLHTAIGILAALVERGKSKEGQHIALNLLNSALSGLANQTSGVVAAGSNPRRMGNEHPSLYPYGPFKAKDREIIVCIGNDNQFERFMTALEAEEGKEERFSTVAKRNENRKELGPIIEKYLAAKTADEWYEIFSEIGVPASQILPVNEGVEFADSLGLEPVVLSGEGEDDPIPGIRNPIELGRTPADYPKAPPALDADHEQVLAWLDRTEAKK